MPPRKTKAKAGETKSKTCQTTKKSSRRKAVSAFRSPADAVSEISVDDARSENTPPRRYNLRNRDIHPEEVESTGKKQEECISSPKKPTKKGRGRAKKNVTVMDDVQQEANMESLPS